MKTKETRTHYSPRRNGFMEAFNALARALDERFTPAQQAQIVFDGEEDPQVPKGTYVWEFRDPSTRTYYRLTYSVKTKEVVWDVHAPALAAHV